MKVTPYLMFNGRCDEAITFYKTAIGAEVMALMRFKDNPDKPPPNVVPPSRDEKVMHSCLRIGESQVMASDAMCDTAATFEGINLSLNAKDEADADRLFNALAQGGQVKMPLGRTFFSPRFGMVADKFGVTWMVIVEPPQKA